MPRVPAPVLKPLILLFVLLLPALRSAARWPAYFPIYLGVAAAWIAAFYAAHAWFGRAAEPGASPGRRAALELAVPLAAGLLLPVLLVVLPAQAPWLGVERAWADYDMAGLVATLAVFELVPLRPMAAGRAIAIAAPRAAAWLQPLVLAVFLALYLWAAADTAHLAYQLAGAALCAAGLAAAGRGRHAPRPPGAGRWVAGAAIAYGLLAGVAAPIAVDVGLRHLAAVTRAR